MLPKCLSVLGLLATVFVLSACDGTSNSTPSPVVATPTPAPVVRTVRFDANGATGAAPGPMTFSAGQAVMFPQADLTVSGHTFAGWNTRADGTGANYAPETTNTLANADVTLYAKFNVIPIKIAQTGDASQSRLVIEWYDGSKQDIVYSASLSGLGNSYDFNPVVGGIAILAAGSARYMHTCYPEDYHDDRQPLMRVTSGGSVLLSASSSVIAGRSGALAIAGAAVTANEIVVTVTGRLLDLDADTEVELVFRADAPRMVQTRSKISYTRTVTVARMYHQTVHANPTKLTDPITYLYVKGGSIVDNPTLATNLTGGIFYKSEANYYVGFTAPRNGALDFYAWRDGPYFAAYKIVYDHLLKQAGDVTESRSTSMWGTTTPEARKYLGWSETLRAGGTIDASILNRADRAALNMISGSFS